MKTLNIKNGCFKKSKSNADSKLNAPGFAIQMDIYLEKEAFIKSGTNHQDN